MKPSGKDWHKFHYGEKLRRKAKKYYLGKRMKKRELRALLASVRIIKNTYPNSADILPYAFCPKCGCKACRSTGNMTSYPERWEEMHCARCRFLVESSNNSPYYHCLEFPESNFVIGGYAL